MDQKRQMSNLFQSTENPKSIVTASFDLLLSIALLESAIWIQAIAIRAVVIAAAMFFLGRCLILYAIPTWKSISEYRLSRPQTTRSGTPFSVASAVVIASFVLATLLAVTFYFLDLWSPVQLQNLQRTAFDWLIVKIPTVILQQLVFQLIIIPTLYFLTGSVRLTVSCAAIVFGLLHLPNPLLMLLTALIGLVWFAVVFKSAKTLIPITISHLILALAVGNIAEEFVFDMRVGPVCFQKWPYEIKTADSSTQFSVYPRLLFGNVESVTQTGNQLVFIGSAFDRDRNKSPAEILVVFGSFDPAIESVSENESTIEQQEHENWIPQRVISVKPGSSDGSFQFQLANNNRKLETEIRLFARHRNGWAYPIHGSTRLTSFSNQQSLEMVCLHPREYEGNIGHLKKRKNRIDVIGWGFSLFSKEKLINELLVESNGRLIPVPFERRTRTEIAKTFDDQSILKCGFVARLDANLKLNSNAVYVRNSLGILERIPQRLQHRDKPTHQTDRRLSKQQNERKIR